MANAWAFGQPLNRADNIRKNDVFDVKGLVDFDYALVGSSLSGVQAGQVYVCKKN